MPNGHPYCICQRGGDSTGGDTDELAAAGGHGSSGVSWRFRDRWKWRSRRKKRAVPGGGQCELAPPLAITVPTRGACVAGMAAPFRWLGGGVGGEIFSGGCRLAACTMADVNLVIIDGCLIDVIHTNCVLKACDFDVPQVHFLNFKGQDM